VDSEQLARRGAGRDSVDLIGVPSGLAAEEAEMIKTIASLSPLGAAATLMPARAWAQGPTDFERYTYGPHMMWWAKDGTE
jgi:hypothetical protein